MLLEAYTTYIQGLSDALTRLDECKLHFLDFQQFLHDVWKQENVLSIDDFLLLPVHHLRTVKSEFEDMLQKCPTDGDLGIILDSMYSVLNVSSNPYSF